MDGFRNSTSNTGNASTNTRGGYYNNKNHNNRNKFNNRRNNNNSNNSNNNPNNSNGNNGNNGNGPNGSNGNTGRMPNSPSKQQMPNQMSPSHYSNGNGFNFNSDYQNRNERNDMPRNNYGNNNFGNKFNNNQNSPNGGNGKKYNNNRYNNKRRGDNNYGHQNYNYQQGSNVNGYKNGQMNRSLSKESPNGSFAESGSNIPTSISLDNFEAKQRSPVMTSSYSFTNGSQSPSYTMKTFVPTNTISENEPTVAEVAEEPSVGQTANADATSFYGSPMSHISAPLTSQSESNLNTTPTAINNSTDDDSTGSPTVVSKAESKGKTDDQISSLSSSSSPDSRNMNNETSESQLLVTASEGEISFGNDEPSNVENTIMQNPNDSTEHETLANLMVNTKITDIDEFIKQQNEVMSSMISKTVTVTETTMTTTTTTTEEQVEPSASGVVNYNNANNDELDGKIKSEETPKHEAKKSHDEHNTSTSSSSSSSSSSDDSSTTISSTTTSSPQSSIDPSSSSSSSTSFSNNHNGEKANDAAGSLDKEMVNIRLDIEYDPEEKEPAPAPAPEPEPRALDMEVTSEDFKSDLPSLTLSNTGNMETDHHSLAMYPSLQSNAVSEMETIVHQSPEGHKDEEVTCLVSKLVSDVISQAIQTAPAPMAYDEIEMDDDEPAKGEEKGVDKILAAFDNDHGSYYRNRDGQVEPRPDMTQRESIQNLKNIDEDDEETDKLQIDTEKNVSFTRQSEEDVRRASERGHMNSPTGEIDLKKMEAMNSALAGKTAPADAKPQTSKSAKKSQEPVVDCFSCNII